MNQIEKSLLRINYVKAIADTFSSSNEMRLKDLATKLSRECTEAQNSFLWNTVKINLTTIQSTVERFCEQVYGDKYKPAIDGLRLIGFAIAQLEDVLYFIKNPERREKIANCLETAMQISLYLDEDYSEIDLHCNAAQDAAAFNSILNQ